MTEQILKVTRFSGIGAEYKIKGSILYNNMNKYLYSTKAKSITIYPKLTKGCKIAKLTNANGDFPFYDSATKYIVNKKIVCICNTELIKIFKKVPDKIYFKINTE